MLSIAHCATGAFLATKLQNPLLFVPITLGSHYVEDWIKHWDVGTGLSHGLRKRSTAFLLELIDLAVAGGVVFALYPLRFPLTWSSIIPYVGAFVALIPDFLEAPRNFLKWEPWFLKPFNAFHHHIHRSIPNMWVGLAPQVLVLLFIFFAK
ncbi:MAG: hypothetical protein UX04_C0003G0072 [Microgenomates group bacterium GW2011_GWF2_45_18]|nr:MAG: hypothetical protein UW18_C0002G0072 [Microgenomates group bacterium GW2011_GWF1_44_10]KKU01800.1 MAG: hypothetical protein UX04_C0003G0072 [Microgenomates group bacterium GW2011_GWF2_45_18]HAU98896.1 hypothetical protein [Candidatus Paceibacterota bacterium]HAX01147.1 hypothetical protein [Candidatus Paceibacterota bacterium]